MFYLLLSIACSSLTVLFFKIFELKNVAVFPAIVFNYFSCTLTGLLVSGGSMATPVWSQSWFPYALFLGVLFICIFFAIAQTTQQMGVSVSMVAAKLSVIIPVLLAVALYHERISALQLSGIVVGLLSVYFISIKDAAHPHYKKAQWLLPLLVFMGSGIIDSTFNHINKILPAASAGESAIVSTAFATAFGCGFSVLCFRPTLFSIKNIAWGLLLGVPNFFSMYFLLRTLTAFREQTAFIFPVNNIGIVALSTILALLLFKEKLNGKNKIGLLLAALALVLISLK